MCIEVVEAFTAAKQPQRPNEDTLVTTGDFLAVIDGATDKAGITYRLGDQTVTSARFAAQTVAAAIFALPDSDVCATDAVAHLSAALHAATVAQQPDLARNQYPACSLILYSRARHEVWSVGDCSWAFNGVERRGGKPVDDLTASLRAQVTQAYLDDGWSAERLAAEDPGRAAIQSLLNYQILFANRVSDLGYGVLNGLPVPDRFIEVHPLTGPGLLTLTSDGYPAIRETRADSEAHLADLIAADPLCIGPLTGTKAVAPGTRFYDDRTWLQAHLH